ncbi:hypothetical protein HII31_02287, partial [Pseudocercospora fuligena]
LRDGLLVEVAHRVDRDLKLKLPAWAFFSNFRRLEDGNLPTIERTVGKNGGQRTNEWLFAGTPTASVSKEVAEVQRLLKKSGVKYSMHSAGTTLGSQHFCLHRHVEGSWDQCMQIIGQCHSMLHARGVVRIQSDIRVGSRTDTKQSFEDKVSAVEKLLAAEEEDVEDEDAGEITYKR